METNCQFNSQNLEKGTQRKSKYLLDHQLLKNNYTLGIGKLNSKNLFFHYIIQS